MKKTILIITPHLSTGGCPQVVLNKIELLKETYNLICIEWECIAWAFVVQRNKIMNHMGDKFYSLGQNKEYELFNIIEDHKPDIISMEEFPEFFMPDHITKRLYSKDRKYEIFETTHNSSFQPSEKRFFPDKFIFVCAFNALKYNIFDIPYEVIEYPVDQKEKHQLISQQELGFDPEWKHVVNVGLFTPGKNQGYGFEMCRLLEQYKIKFHFVGNQAGNFEHYWKPIMDNKPDNCVIWGERSDVSTFLKASDLFLFTSIYELNPISLKEALEYDLPIMMHNLDVYCGKYNENKNFTMLTGDLGTDCNNLISILNPPKFEVPENLNIKLVHILLDPNHPEYIPLDSWKSTIDKQNFSIQCWEKIKHKFTSYIPRYSIVNRTELPVENCKDPDIVNPSKEFKNEPPVLTYGHYGAYKAHTQGIYENFDENVDLLIIVEGDSYTDLSADEFYNKVIESYNLAKKINGKLISFAGPCYMSGGEWWTMSKEHGDWLEVPHFLMGTAYSIMKSERENMFYNIKNTGWHSPDFWLSWNYHAKSKILVSKEKIVNQKEGYSVLDYLEK
jgi:hypothetical protein